MLKSVCQLINLQNVVQNQSNEVNINDFIKTIKERHHQFSDEPLISIYYRVFDVINRKDELDHYFKLKTGLDELREKNHSY